ncbi:hypothetical protein F-E9_142 [Faustovirus]|nr:hypothetical protein F-E9_142 [Faustovirus]
MGKAEWEAVIIECGETNYTKYKKFIYDTFTKIMNNSNSIGSLSERILELILENNDITLLRKYSHYYTFVIFQSYSHYLEYAEIHNAAECHRYLKKLNRCVYVSGRRK